MGAEAESLPERLDLLVREKMAEEQHSNASQLSAQQLNELVDWACSPDIFPVRYWGSVISRMVQILEEGNRDKEHSS